MAMKIVNGLQQGSAQWHAHRAKYRNASDAPAMLGCSPYKNRRDYIRMMATGLAEEITKYQQAIFDEGHRNEWLGRALGEQILEDDLSPTVCVNGEYSASLDGMTFCGTALWEHKLLSSRLMEAMFEGCTGADLPLDYQVQMEHQLMVTGAERVLFTASKWVRERYDLPETDPSAWRLVEARHCMYFPNPELRAQLVAGWEQTTKDIADYQPEPEPVALVGKAPALLPALKVTVVGSVPATNLPEFKAVVVARLESIQTKLVTDQDFADAQSTVKWCEDAESRLQSAKEIALADAEAIQQLFATMDELTEMTRQVRLKLKKQIETEKENRKAELVQGYDEKLEQHYNALNAKLPHPYLKRPLAQFGPAIKGLRSIKSMEDALSETLARLMGAATIASERYTDNRKFLQQDGIDWLHLFPDFQTVGAKGMDDFEPLATLRIGNHKRAEEERLEADRARIRQEEAEKLRKEQEAKEQAEAAAKAKADAEAKRLAEPEPVAAPAPAVAQAPNPKPVNHAPLTGNLPEAPVPLKDLIEQGKTITLGEINHRLAVVKVDANTLTALDIPSEKSRGAVHIAERSFPKLCDSLVEHIQAARERSEAGG